MKVLSRAAANSLQKYVLEYGRPLESARLAYLLDGAGVDPILQELGPFQNQDGGFGHGLEPDFWLPDSSPMATSMAFRLLDDLPVASDLPLIQQGLDYYEATFNPQLQYWQPTGTAVNQYPHAPWWEVDEEEMASKESASSRWDGNPSAEILGHLLRYRGSASRLDLATLVDAALADLKGQQRYETHEIQCYLKLYGQLPAARQAEIQPVLRRAITQLVEPDVSRWGGYVAKPLDFVGNLQSPFYPDLQELVHTQLDYLIDQVEQQGIWAPTWEWGNDEEHWQQARQMWIGVLACNHVASLKAFGRVEAA